MTQISEYQPPEFKESEPFFSRRTLWVVNLILIPLIYVLSQVGRGDSDDMQIEYVAPTLQFPLEEVVFNQTQFGGMDLHWANLKNSQTLFFGFVLDRQPIASVEIPPLVNLNTKSEGGKLWVQIEMPNNREVIYDALVFMRDWLPMLTSENEVVIVGELDENVVANLIGNLVDNNGAYSEFFTNPSKFVQTLEAPQIGSENFEVFFVAHLIIKSRILSNRIALAWDTKTPRRLLGVNSVMDANWLLPVTSEEFDLVMARLNKSLVEAQLSPQSIMRYLMHQAGYNLELDYFHTRALRYNQVTLPRINEQLSKLQEMLIK